MVAVRETISTGVTDDVRVYLPASALNDSDTKEFVANDRFEQSVASKANGRMLFDDIAVKADFIRTFAEDVLVIDKLKPIAAKLGLTMQPTPFPFYQYRGSVAATVYYYMLAKLRLSAFLVCTANIMFEKG